MDSIDQVPRYRTLRTKFFSDLHDDVGTSLASVAMQTELMGLSAPEEHRVKYQKICRLSREAMGRICIICKLESTSVSPSRETFLSCMNRRLMSI